MENVFGCCSDGLGNIYGCRLDGLGIVHGWYWDEKGSVSLSNSSCVGNGADSNIYISSDSSTANGKTSISTWNLSMPLF